MADFMHAPTDCDPIGAVPRAVANTSELREVGSVEVMDGFVLTAEAAVELVRRVVYDCILADCV